MPPRTGADRSIVVQGVVLRTGEGERIEVLLVHRSSPRAWELPGGKPDPGESFEAAVVREVREETSVHVEAVRHVATYRRIGFRPHTSPVFHCVPVSGRPVPNEEAVAASFHPVDRLPWGTFPWLREAISLAVDAATSAAHPGTRVPLERVQHLGTCAVARSLLIHMAGVARLRD